jgi:co-chaperonin GroES (HSP10)
MKVMNKPKNMLKSELSEVRRIRRINPLGMRVVVKLQKETNTTEGGLYLPEGAKQSMAESLLAEVLEVASATDEHSDEETNVSGIPLGAMVLVPKHAGVKIPWDDTLRIVETKEILALVNEMEVS